MERTPSSQPSPPVGEREKKRTIGIALWTALAMLLVIAATVVTPGRRISEYPHASTLNDSDLLVAARTNTVPATNVNISALEFLRQGTNALATTGYVNTVGTTVSNGVVTLISYNTPSVISGAGSGSTNYTLQVTSPKMLLGSSNVNIVAVMQTIAGKTHNWSVNITNLSADTWGISFSSATNRWKFQSWMYGTNAPSVLTNNTLLRLQGESEGTNTLVTYQYFSPAL